MGWRCWLIVVSAVCNVDTASILVVLVVGCPCGCGGWNLTTAPYVRVSPAAVWVGICSLLVGVTDLSVWGKGFFGFVVYFGALGVPLLLRTLNSSQEDFPHSYSILAAFLWDLCSLLWCVSQHIWRIWVLYDSSWQFLHWGSNFVFLYGVTSTLMPLISVISYIFLDVFSSIELWHKCWHWFFSFPF